MPLSNIYNTDCLEAMRAFPDKHFQLAIVDPPYGIDITKAHLGNTRPGKYGQKSWDKQSPDVAYFEELRRVSANQIVWGANHFISKMPYDSDCWIVWDKNRKCDYADCELAWTSFDSPARIFKFTWDGYRQADMKNKEHRIHPTQKPVALYKWLLSRFAKPGDTILDTHLGSGSSRIAAYDMGFDFVGYELDAEYFAASDKRFREFAAQTVLF